MKLRYKILNGILAVIGITIVLIAFTLSYNSDCGPVPVAEEGADLMRANLLLCYGPVDVIEFAEVAVPTPAADEVLVKVISASVNPLDWHFMRGSPYIMRLMSGIGAPHSAGMGVDFAGTVAAVGSNVDKFKVGDEVFGGRDGAYAEYVLVNQNHAIVLKPANVSFDQAATLPIAGVTAVQALRVGDIKPGQKVLINGASGGVGIFAVQIAKSLGAEVTGVNSTRNIDLVRSLGADHMIDYKKTDYTDADVQYDVIIDMVGNHSPLENSRMLTPTGTLVIVGGQKGNWLGPLMGPIKALIASKFVDQTLHILLADLTSEDLSYLADLMSDGKLKAVIERSYSLSEVGAAIEHSEEGHVRGKLIVAVTPQ